MTQGSRNRLDWLAATLVASTVWLFSPSARGAPEATFAVYFGSWTGMGQVSLTGGNIESLKCNAYYTSKDAGQSMGLALRCASPSNNLEIRAVLTSKGQTISGVWQEQTFNAAGNVVGTADSGKIDLAIKGGGFSGSMLVTMDGEKQKVAIQADGIAIKSINMSFSRN